MTSRRSDEAKEWRQLYATRDWKRARRDFLADHPLCFRCRRHGLVEASVAVNHIRPHRGNIELFWDRGNWEAVCATHHASADQRRDKQGYDDAVGEDGWPIDPAHPFYRGRSDA